MNRKPITVLLVITLSALMVACAAQPERKSPTEPNAEYVGSVERVANQVGARVIWINPPRRARTDDDNDA